MQQQCEIAKGWFRSCGRPAAGSCQYCGRAFCDQHGIFREEHQEICTRKIYQEKHADVAVHQSYKEEAQRRNYWNQCGTPGCTEGFAGQCSRCRLLYCDLHLLDRAETVRRGYGRVTQPASMCEHCWGRRRLWNRS